MRLIKLLVIAVAMISRRSRWRFNRTAKRFCTGAGKYRASSVDKIGIFRHVGMNERAVQPYLAVAQS